MYDVLKDIAKRPEPFSRSTVKELWTRPHLARQMLNYHLSQETDLASRKHESIDRVVEWIDSQLNLSGKSLCDLGCGPGLYAQRFEARGAQVTGVDFSAHSLDYAKVLSPEQRKLLLARMHGMLNPGGQIVLDVAGIGSFEQKDETTLIQDKMMGGFWAAGDYVGIQQSFVYPEECLSLDRYVIVEPGETWQIYNWMQYFTPESAEAELKSAGFEIRQMVGELTGVPLTPKSDFIGVVAGAV
jgi:hypothetical protein